MAKIVTRTVKWDAVPPEVQVTGYRVYVAKAGVPHSYDLPHADVAANLTQLVLPCEQLPQSLFVPDGDYSVWITTLEQGGNESDPLALSGRFDFTPPPAPTNGRIEIS